MNREPIAGELVLLRQARFSEDGEYTRAEIGRYVSRDGPHYKIEVFPCQRVSVARSAFDILSDVLSPRSPAQSLLKMADCLFRIASNDAPAYYRAQCQRLLAAAQGSPPAGPLAQLMACASANLQAYLADHKMAVLQGKYFMRNAGKAIAEMDGWNPELRPGQP